MSVVEIRSVHDRSELEQCYDLWDHVFPDGRAFFQKRLDDDGTYSFETTFIAKVDGCIACAIQVFPYFSWIGDTLIKVGGIGNVATLPQYRGRGLAQSVLRQQSKWMKSQGFDLSPLFTGIHSFYQQVGWEGVAEPLYHWEAEPLDASDTNGSYDISPFRIDDLAEVEAIYDRYNFHRTNAMLRTDEYWRSQLTWTGFAPSNFFLVARAGGKIVSYLRWQLSDEDGAQIRELCYDDQHTDSALALYRQVQILAPRIKQFEARLPFDHRLLQLAGNFNLQQSDFAHTMWKVLSPTILLQRLRGTLSQRWGEATDANRESHTLLVHIDGEDVEFVMRQHTMDVVQAERSLYYHRELFLNRGDLATLLTQGIHAVQNLKLRDDEDLRVLFPDQPSMLWQTDFF